MTEPLSVSTNAGLVFGTNTPRPRQVVKDACEGMGWARVVSRPPSLHSALQAACCAVAKPLLRERNMPLVVRALDHDLAFEAVRIRRGHAKNETILLFSCEVDEATQGVSLLDYSRSLSPTELLVALDAEYTSRRKNLSAAQVRTVVRSVIQKLRGVDLEGRCVYFLPQDALARWLEWKDAARMNNYHVVPFEVAKDPATIAHVLQALNEEVAAQSVEIDAAILAGGISRRQAKSLRRRAAALIDKIQSYEKALGQQLDWMKEPLHRATTSVAVCDLLCVSI
jgi:hypothetical protein